MLSRLRAGFMLGEGMGSHGDAELGVGRAREVIPVIQHEREKTEFSSELLRVRRREVAWTSGGGGGTKRWVQAIKTDVRAAMGGGGGYG